MTSTKPASSDQNECEPDQDTPLENYAQGAVSNHLAQLFTGLQAHKSGMHLAQQWAERANRIGWANAGVDVSEIDKDMKAAGEDVDQSIRFSGDTHIHVGAEDINTSPPGKPTAPPAPARRPSSLGRWLTAAAILGTAGAAGGGALTAYLLNRPETNTTGGSVFDFSTELPPWMQEDGSNSP